MSHDAPRVLRRARHEQLLVKDRLLHRDEARRLPGGPDPMSNRPQTTDAGEWITVILIVLLLFVMTFVR